MSKKKSDIISQIKKIFRLKNSVVIVITDGGMLDPDTIKKAEKHCDVQQKTKKHMCPIRRHRYQQFSFWVSSFYFQLHRAFAAPLGLVLGG